MSERSGIEKNIWTDEQEHLLKKWGEEAKGYAWMHHKCERWFNVWDKIITIPAVILPALIGSFFFTVYVDVKAVQITYGILLILLTVVTALQTYLEWSKRSTLHKEASLHYQFYADDIEAELALVRSERSVGLFQKMKEKRKTMINRYPNIIKKYEDEYKQKFPNNEISKPTIIDVITGIEINNQENNKDNKRDIPIEIINKEKYDPKIQYELDRYLKDNNV